MADQVYLQLTSTNSLRIRAMSTVAKQKEEIAQKAKAARELCTTMEAKVEEQNKTRNKEMDFMKKQIAEAAVRHTKLMWCTAVMLTVLSLCLAASALLSFNTFRGLEELHAKCVSSVASTVDQVSQLRAEAKQTSTQLQKLEDVEEKYVQLLGHHNDLFGKTSNLFHQVNKLTQEQNANEHNLSTLEGTVSSFTSEMELTSRTTLNADVMSAFNKTLREMNGTIDTLRQEKSGVLTKCCRDLESKLSKLNDTLQENTEVVRTEQDKVKSLDSLLTYKLSAASLEQKETFDVVKVEQERMNIMVTHLSDNIRHLEGKLEKLSSTALSQQEAHVHPEYADQFQQLFDEGARLVERMKQLEETSLNHPAEMTKFNDSTKTSMEALQQYFDTETRRIEEHLKKLEESIYESSGTCSDTSECQKSALFESVRHNSSEL
ncbi:hypothetical protein EMCRGX_G010324 [Ephydatia muelleri]